VILKRVVQYVSLRRTLPKVHTLVAQGSIVGAIRKSKVNLRRPGLLLLDLLLDLPLYASHIGGPVALACGFIEDQRRWVTCLEGSSAPPTVYKLVAIVWPS
jgi:hypothetical protein